MITNFGEFHQFSKTTFVVDFLENQCYDQFCIKGGNLSLYCQQFSIFGETWLNLATQPEGSFLKRLHASSRQRGA
jgi:hypothetical protein